MSDPDIDRIMAKERRAIRALPERPIALEAIRATCAELRAKPLPAWASNPLRPLSPAEWLEWVREHDPTRHERYMAARERLARLQQSLDENRKRAAKVPPLPDDARARRIQKLAGEYTRRKRDGE